jgi:hypothetical protein
MSLPFYQITCSNCEYEDSYNYGVHYQYQGLKEYEPVLHAAWCGNCDKIERMLSSLTVEDAEYEIQDLNRWIKRYQEGFFAKYLKSKKKEVLQCKIEIGEFKARLQHFENQHYKNRCLNCKGHNVFSLFLPSEGEGVKESQIKHTCGGNLRVHQVGRVSFARHKKVVKVVYDENGNILIDTRSN